MITSRIDKYFRLVDLARGAWRGIHQQAEIANPPVLLALPFMRHDSMAFV
jgi:hypothetical protein